MTGAEVHITKLASAERQLRAAIRLFFAEEDELAIHTVAAAAYQVLADLKRHRGRDEAADAYYTGLFYLVRDYQRGTLSEEMKGNAELMEWLAANSESFPIDASSNPSQITASAAPGVMRKKYWDERHRFANFLKHAGGDATASISLEKLDNLTLLLQGICAYLDLTGSLPGEEALVMQLYLDAREGHPPPEDHDRRQVAARLTTLDESQRKRICLELVRSRR